MEQSLDSQSRASEIITILAVFSAISTIAVTLRVYARWYLLHTFGPDDAVMVFAQFLTIGAAVCEGLEARYGLGRHQWTFKKQDQVPYLKSFYSSVVIYNVGLCLVKISILLQYRRIFVGAIIRRLTLVLLVLFSAWTLVMTFLLSLVCVPVAKFWNPMVEGHCLNELAIWYTVAGINLITDFTVCGMPLPVISHLQLPRQQKLLLVGVFCLGLFTCIISIIRIPTLSVAARTQDGTWDNVNAAVWSFLELSIAILTACLPTLRPIFVKIMPGVFGASSTKGRTGRPSAAGYFPNTESDNTKAGSAWKRSKAMGSLHSPTSVIKDSDSTEELRSTVGGLTRGSGGDDDDPYGLQDLSTRPDDIDDKNYTFVVSAGRSDADMDVPSQRNAAARGGIQTTTMITQRVEIAGKR